MGPLSLPIQAAYTYIPTSENADYRLVTSSAAAGVDFGCQGVTMDGSLQATLDNFQQIASGLPAQAPALALNYLIYSSPSLYALVQNLKEAVDFNLNGANLACNTARTLGKQAWADDPAAVAQDECISQNGGLSDKCVSLVNPTVNSFIDKKNEWSTAVEDAVGSVETFMGSSCPALDSDQPTLMMLVLGRGSGRCEDITTARRVLIDMEINPEAADFKRISPVQSLSEFTVETNAGYSETIDTIVEQPTETFHTLEPYQSSIKGEHRAEISLSQHRMLKQMKAKAPRSYDAYIAKLAMFYTANDLEDLADRIEVGLNQGNANSELALLPGEETAKVLAQVEGLRDYSGALKRRLERQTAEAQFLDEGYRILMQAERE